MYTDCADRPSALDTTEVLPEVSSPVSMVIRGPAAVQATESTSPRSRSLMVMAAVPGVNAPEVAVVARGPTSSPPQSTATPVPTPRFSPDECSVTGAC